MRPDDFAFLLHGAYLVAIDDVVAEAVHYYHLSCLASVFYDQAFAVAAERRMKGGMEFVDAGGGIEEVRGHGGGYCLPRNEDHRFRRLRGRGHHGVKNRFVAGAVEVGDPAAAVAAAVTARVAMNWRKYEV